METHTEETHIEATRIDTGHDHHEDHNTEEKNDSLWIRFLVITGVVVILFFISISIVKLVPKMFSSVGNLFGNGIEVSTNAKEVDSAGTFVLNWKNNTENKDGVYTVNFACTTNIKVEYNTKDGLKPVICNTLFPLPKETGSYPFTVMTENEKDATLNFVITLWDTTTNKEKLTGKGKISILGLGTKTTVATSTVKDNSVKTVDLYTPSNNTTSSTTKKDTKILPVPKTYTGNPDMAIRMVEIGWVDFYGSYHSGVSIPDGARVLVKFNVSNVGTAPTGAWTISATLPTKTVYERNFYSKTEPSVMPGASFDLSLAFDDFDSYSPTMTITLQNSIDLNTANNTLVVTSPVR
jgi:hypothetical protein